MSIIGKIDCPDQTRVCVWPVFSVFFLQDGLALFKADVLQVKVSYVKKLCKKFSLKKPSLIILKQQDNIDCLEIISYNNFLCLLKRWHNGFVLLYTLMEIC